MKNLLNSYANRYRVRSHLGLGDETCGAFVVPSPIDGAPMKVIASAGCGWDHVSVSRVNRCPNWPEMESVRELFFRDDETVVQFSVPRSDHVNFHPNCLHMWRPQDVEIPRPPAWMVGPEKGETIEDVIAKAITA